MKCAVGSSSGGRPEGRELTKQAAEDAQGCRVSGAVQEDHQAAPGAQVLLPEAEDLLHLAFGRRFLFLGRCILLGTFFLSISAHKSAWKIRFNEQEQDVVVQNTTLQNQVCFDLHPADITRVGYGHKSSLSAY